MLSKEALEHELSRLNEELMLTYEFQAETDKCVGIFIGY